MPSTTPCDEDSTYVVTAVRYATLPARRSALFLNYDDYGVADAPGDLDYYFWVIRNDRRTVVFDTGFDPAVGTRRGRSVLIDPRDAMDVLGVGDDHRTIVVLSHLHYDHVGNLARFVSSRVVLAAREYDFWVRSPRRLHLTDQLVEAAELATVRAVHVEGRLDLLGDGDSEIAPGIVALAGYGHTPGQLMLFVQTADGAVLLTSDAVHLDEELERRMPFRHMCDLASSADTYDRIDELVTSGHVVRVAAGHQPGLVGRFPRDFSLPDHTAVLSSRPTTESKEGIPWH
jgi:glyoxylase-like metal-dependent hydrolase (beta-lactamase superfamily II)